MIRNTIIDNDKVTLANVINEILKTQCKLDVASAYFNIGAIKLIKDNLNNIKEFRLLLGKAPETEIKTPKDFDPEIFFKKNLKKDLEKENLDRNNDSSVKNFIDLLKQEKWKVRIYKKGFLHGKTYITDDYVIVGSSNFTYSGFTANTELNLLKIDPFPTHIRDNWFNKHWENTEDFKREFIKILSESKFGIKEYLPYEIFIKSLYELQKEDIDEILSGDEHKLDDILTPSKVELSEFQADGVDRIKNKLKKYNSVLIADSVGLGKTWIAKKIIELYGYYRRQKVLIIGPAQLRGMWKKEITSIDVVFNFLSQEELSNIDFMEKLNKILNNDIKNLRLIIVDESHNFRNQLSNKFSNFVTLYEKVREVSKGETQIIFMTATPINNNIWDLYSQIFLLVRGKKNKFLKVNIPDLFKFFKEAEKKGVSRLSDLMNEISIRRTRNFIKRNYPNAQIYGKLINFPDRKLVTVHYELDKVYRGMYHEIANSIDNMKMAYYTLLDYKKKLTKEEEWEKNRMIALSGIFRTILLKRIESSVQAFKISIERHIKFLELVRKFYKKGIVIRKKFYLKYSNYFEDEFISELTFEEIINNIEDDKTLIEKINIEDYYFDKLLKDLDKDIEDFKGLYSIVSLIDTNEDAKLKRIEQLLLEISNKEQVIIFTYYADTLNYLDNYLKNSSLLKNKKISSISGKVSSKAREKIVNLFEEKELDILISTDVLSEGQNLQTAKFLINYDLHWNPTRMIQRAGRIDRIGSEFKEIKIYNFFPEKELEELLKLVKRLQQKIQDIDETVGLDQSVLGEKIHPKVFGTLRRIEKNDESILDELENEVFGGGDIFYQPLLDFIKKESIDKIKNLPHGIHSGLKNNKIRGIFFYYKYKEHSGGEYHYWYVYDIENKRFLKSQSEIIQFIECKEDKPREIPNFKEMIYEINNKLILKIEEEYKQIYQQIDAPIPQTDQSSVFIYDKTIQKLNALLIENDFDNEIDKYEKMLENISQKLSHISLTKKRISHLRKINREYKDKYETYWKIIIKKINDFLNEISENPVDQMEEFDKSRLELITFEYIS